MELTGADILIECLKEQGVDTVFGYPGGKVLFIYDSLYRNKDKIKHILTAHEQGASHAADGYSRATGKVGVCLATSGPGATNLVTGIATAYMDSIPMIAITGNVALNLLGKDSFQEVDIAGVTLPVTKHNYIVDDVNKLADIVREAFYIAQEGRPGPVLIDIPSDLTTAKASYTAKVPRVVERKMTTFHQSAFDEAVQLINESHRPFILAGGGVVRSKAADELKTFTELLGAPIACSLMAQSAFPYQHPLFTGMIGMHGSKVSNTAVAETDLLILIGARMSDRIISKVEKFAQNAKILHIDIDPAEINKNLKAEHHIIGDIKTVLARLNPLLKKQDKKEWNTRIASLKKDFPLRYTEENSRSRDILEALTEITKGDALVVTEVGQHQMWAAQFFGFAKPYTFLTSGGLGTMGFGTGAAIGAQIGCPDKIVFNIAGDGCFRMNCNELSTAVKYKVPIKIIMFNNHTLGMVRQWQTLFFDKRYAETDLDHDIDWIKLAEAFGAKGLSLSKTDDAKTVLQKALDTPGPVLVVCEIPIDDKVFPMVPPGAAVEDVLLRIDD